MKEKSEKCQEVSNCGVSEWDEEGSDFKPKVHPTLGNTEVELRLEWTQGLNLWGRPIMTAWQCNLASQILKANFLTS